MKLGRAIKTCRESKGLNRREFADQCGLTRAAISNYESGTRGIQNETLTLIAKELHIPLVLLVYLASDTDDLEGIDEDLNTLLRFETMKYLGLYDHD